MQIEEFLLPIEGPHRAPVPLVSSHTMSIAEHTALVNAAMADPVLRRWVEEARGKLATDGYAVIPYVLCHDEATAAHEAIWSAIAISSQQRANPLPMQRPLAATDLPADFKLTTDWPLNSHGILGDGAWSHLPVVHDVRMHPRVIAVYALLNGGDTNLIGSCDRINYLLPPEFLKHSKGAFVEHLHQGGEGTRYPIASEATWLHVDQALRTPGARCIQGLVQLTDAFHPGDGSFECLPGSHLLHSDAHGPKLEETLGRVVPADKCRPNWFKFDALDKAALARHTPAGLLTVRATRGSLVLWDSRLAHQGGKIRADARHPRLHLRPRCVVYVCYQPLADPQRTLAPEEQVKRNKLIDTKSAMAHWPLKTKLFGPPRTYGKTVEPFAIAPQCVDIATAPVVAHYLGYQPGYVAPPKVTGRKRARSSSSNVVIAEEKEEEPVCKEARI